MNDLFLLLVDNFHYIQKAAQWLWNIITDASTDISAERVVKNMENSSGGVESMENNGGEDESVVNSNEPTASSTSSSSEFSNSADDAAFAEARSFIRDEVIRETKGTAAEGAAEFLIAIIEAQTLDSVRRQKIEELRRCIQGSGTWRAYPWASWVYPGVKARATWTPEQRARVRALANRWGYLDKLGVKVFGKLAQESRQEALSKLRQLKEEEKAEAAFLLRGWAYLEKWGVRLGPKGDEAQDNALWRLGRWIKTKWRG